MINNFSPIDLTFIASGILIQEKAKIGSFVSERRKQEPSWLKSEDPELDCSDLSLPITPSVYWDGRYVLTTLELKNSKGESLQMNEVILSISLQKQIVTTAINGLEGTIKEYISNGDYQIDITAAVVATDDNKNIVDKYPEEGIHQLQQYLNQNETLTAKSPLLRMFDITHLVVSQYAIACDAASNHQVVTIKALSDKDYTIRQEEY